MSQTPEKGGDFSEVRSSILGFFQAACNGSGDDFLERLNALRGEVSHSPCIEFRDSLGRRAVHFACMDGNLDVLKIIAEEGALEVLNDNDESGLFMAVKVAKPDAVKFLLENSNLRPHDRNKTGATPFHLAVDSGCIKTVETLYEYLDNEKSLVSSSLGTPLQVAVVNGDTEMIDRIINMGITRNESDSPLPPVLHLAVSTPNWEDVLPLVLPLEDVEVEDSEGWTPLHTAAELGRLQAVRSLVSAGADVRRSTKGQTAADLARSGGFEEVYNFLRGG